MRYRWWLLIAAIIFIIGMGMGITAPPFLARFLTQQLEGVKEMSLALPPYQVSTAFFILFRNASVVALSYLFSPLLCLVPLLGLLVNSWLIGFVTVAIARQRSVLFLIAGILPHGILELPALVMGQAAALYFGYNAMASLFSAEKRASLSGVLRESLKYLAIALLMLIPAAFIETYITPWFLGLLGA